MISEEVISPAIGRLGTRKALRGVLSGVALLALAGTFSARAQGPPVLHTPAKIAEGEPGQVLVSDSLSRAIFAVDKQTLEVLWNIGVDGEPIGVAAVGDLLLVSNATTQALEVYDRRKEDLSYTIGKDKKGNGPLQLPGDLAVDRLLERIFVLDRADTMVKVFDLKGGLITEFSPVDSQGEALAPTAIAVDESNARILVSDYGDPTGSFRSRVPPRVLVYDYAGTFLLQINGDGVVDGVGRIAELAFARPVGLWVNSLGRLFLVDCVAGHVYVFDLNNMLDPNSAALVKKLGEVEEGEPPELNFPLDVLVDESTGDVFVTNNGFRRIEVYRGEGNTP